MNWIEITSEEDFEKALKSSSEKTVVLFKHSTRCSISSSALNRVERKFQPNEKVDWYFLDLIRFRDVSNLISKKLDIAHESPQVLVIKNQQCVYHESHYGIQFDEIIQAI